MSRLAPRSGPLIAVCWLRFVLSYVRHVPISLDGDGELPLEVNFTPPTRNGNPTRTSNSRPGRH